ncbi:MAG: TRAP transporter TatT component family protein, partial [Candidatus Omnitrophica bacterium]|nr:TRAP transporter TatT component family protein [Candidatus Omnitrophota bacterium]
MKKIIIIIIFFFALWGGLYYLNLNYRKKMVQKAPMPEPVGVLNITKTLDDAMDLLGKRKDRLALAEFEKVLAIEPENIKALWAKAEILRRQYKFSAAEKIFQDILKQDPMYIPALVGVCYIRYHEDKLKEALDMAKKLLDRPDIDKQDKAIVHMLIGSINARKASKGGFFSKIAYGTKIKVYFQKAVDLAPELSEVHLGLGTFYLKAPGIAGGNIDKAIQELEKAVELTPDFATANARLAQAYKKKGDLAKFQHYLQKAREIDPDNEAITEIE